MTQHSSNTHPWHLINPFKPLPPWLSHVHLTRSYSRYQVSPSLIPAVPKFNCSVSPIVPSPHPRMIILLMLRFMYSIAFGVAAVRMDIELIALCVLIAWPRYTFSMVLIVWAGRGARMKSEDSISGKSGCVLLVTMFPFLHEVTYCWDVSNGEYEWHTCVAFNVSTCGMMIVPSPLSIIFGSDTTSKREGGVCGQSFSSLRGLL